MPSNHYSDTIACDAKPTALMRPDWKDRRWKTT
jgi:hypothetical protein